MCRHEKLMVDKNNFSRSLQFNSDEVTQTDGQTRSMCTENQSTSRFEIKQQPMTQFITALSRDKCPAESKLNNRAYSCPSGDGDRVQISVKLLLIHCRALEN